MVEPGASETVTSGSLQAHSHEPIGTPASGLPHHGRRSQGVPRRAEESRSCTSGRHAQSIDEVSGSESAKFTGPTESLTVQKNNRVVFAHDERGFDTSHIEQKTLGEKFRCVGRAVCVWVCLMVAPSKKEAQEHTSGWRQSSECEGMRTRMDSRKAQGSPQGVRVWRFSRHNQE